MTPENKRITVNTIALYVKLFVSIAVGLFSSRIVLNALGVTNYGLYNVVRIAMIVLPYGILHYLLLEENLNVLLATLISFAYTYFTVYSFGLSAEEKTLIMLVINNKLLNKQS